MSRVILIKEAETKRLKLKVLDANFSNIVLDYYVRNKDFFKPWVPEYEEEFYSEEYQRKNLDLDYKFVDLGLSIRYWILKKDDDKRIIGDFAYSHIIRGVFHSCYLGYKIDKDENGKGFATEAIRKGNEMMFEHFRMHRIEANIIPRNTASIKVVKKLGFVEEGLSKKYLKINGKWEDHIHFVLLNEKVE